MEKKYHFQIPVFLFPNSSFPGDPENEQLQRMSVPTVEGPAQSFITSH